MTGISRAARACVASHPSVAVTAHRIAAPAEKAAPAPSEAGPVFTGGAAACAPQPSEGAKHSVTVLVAHGNVIRWMALKALQLNEEAWLRLSASGLVARTRPLTRLSRAARIHHHAAHHCATIRCDVGTHD